MTKLMVIFYCKQYNMPKRGEGDPCIICSKMICDDEFQPMYTKAAAGFGISYSQVNFIKSVKIRCA